MKAIQSVLPKKKIWVFALTLSLGVLLVGSALAQSFGVIYNTDTLNLRSDGSSSSTLLGTYSRGTWLEITGSKNNFYSVFMPDGRRGYMSKNYITKGAEAVSQIAMVTNQGGGAFLNFRAAPSYNAQVLGIFYYGVPLYVNGEQGGWYYVQINGQNGYVRSEYVSLMNVVGSSTVATIKTPNNTAINLRSGPGSAYAVVRQFPGDRYVMVLAKGNGWWRVSIDGYVGFMSSDFLVDGLRAAKDIAAESGGGGTGGTYQPYAVVNNPLSTQALNLRMSASTASGVLEKLYNGTRLYVDAQGAEWCAVTVESTGVSGYVMTSYIKLYNLPTTPTLRVAHPQGLRVNLRTEQSLSSAVRTQVPNGTNVTVLIPGVEWTKVQYGGYTGYMVSYFLQ